MDRARFVYHVKPCSKAGPLKRRVRKMVRAGAVAAVGAAATEAAVVVVIAGETVAVTEAGGDKISRSVENG
jgi:hypothetical protein